MTTTSTSTGRDHCAQNATEHRPSIGELAEDQHSTQLAGLERLDRSEELDLLAWVGAVVSADDLISRIDRRLTVIANRLSRRFPENSVSPAIIRALDHIAEIEPMLSDAKCRLASMITDRLDWTRESHEYPPPQSHGSLDELITADCSDLTASQYVEQLHTAAHATLGELEAFKAFVSNPCAPPTDCAARRDMTTSHYIAMSSTSHQLREALCAAIGLEDSKSKRAVLSPEQVAQAFKSGGIKLNDDEHVAPSDGHSTIPTATGRPPAAEPPPKSSSTTEDPVGKPLLEIAMGERDVEIVVEDTDEDHRVAELTRAEAEVSSALLRLLEVAKTLPEDDPRQAGVAALANWLHAYDEKHHGFAKRFAEEGAVRIT